MYKHKLVDFVIHVSLAAVRASSSSLLTAMILSLSLSVHGGDRQRDQ